MAEPRYEDIEQVVRIGKQLLDQKLELEDEIFHLNNKLKIRVAEVELVTAERDALSSKTTEQGLIIDNLRNEISILTATTNSLNETVARSRIDLAAITTKYRQTTTLNSTISELKSNLEDRTARILSLEAESSGLKNSINVLNTERLELLDRIRDLSELDSQYQNQKVAFRDNIEQLQEVQVRLAQVVHKNDELTSTLLDHKKHIETELATKFSLETEVRDLRVKVAQLGVIQDELTAQLKTYKSENVRLNMETNTHRVTVLDVSGLRTEVQLLQETQREFGIFRETMNQERDLLSRQLADKDAVITRLTEQLEKHKVKSSTTEERYYEKIDELEANLRAKYDLEIQLRSGLDSAESTIVELETKLRTETVANEAAVANLKIQVDKDTRTMEEYKLEITRLRRELKLRDFQIDELSSKVDNITKVKEETISRIRSEHETLVAETSTAQSTELLKLRSQHSNELTILTEELRTLNDQISIIESKWKTKYDRDMAALKDDVNNVQRNSDIHDKRLLDLKIAVADRDEHIKKLEEELKIYLEERVDKQKLHNKLYSDLYNDLNGQINDLETEVKMWKNKYTEFAGQDAASSTEDVRKLHIELSRLRVERDMLSSQYNHHSESSNESSEGPSHAAKAFTLGRKSSPRSPRMGMYNLPQMPWMAAADYKGEAETSTSSSEETNDSTQLTKQDSNKQLIPEKDVKDPPRRDGKTVFQIVDNTKIVIEGLVHRKSGRSNKWKEVYACVEDTVLFYSHDAINKYKRRAIQLLGAKIIVKNTNMIDGIRPYYIMIKTEKREVHLAFKSMDEMNEWAKLFKKLSQVVDPTK